MKPELKELIYEGNLIPGYYINKKGELYSTRPNGLNRYTINNREKVCYGGPMVKRMGTSVGKYIMYRVGKLFTHRQFDDTITSTYFGVQSHRAMMETFKPFEENLPEDLVDVWDSLPQVAKKYIKCSMQVDHIDPDSSKPTFHHLSNMQWLTTIDNNRKSNKVIEPINQLEKLLWNQN